VDIPPLGAAAGFGYSEQTYRQYIEHCIEWSDIIEWRVVEFGEKAIAFIGTLVP